MDCWYEMSVHMFLQRKVESGLVLWFLTYHSVAISKNHHWHGKLVRYSRNTWDHATQGFSWGVSQPDLCWRFIVRSFCRWRLCDLDGKEPELFLPSAVEHLNQLWMLVVEMGHQRTKGYEGFYHHHLFWTCNHNHSLSTVLTLKLMKCEV